MVGERTPSAREGHSSCVLGDDLYVFGGISISSAEEVVENNDLWKFSTASKEWSQMKLSQDTEELPLPRTNATLAAVERKLYLFGGLNQSVGWLDDLCVFDLETGKWSEESDSTGDGPCARDKLTSAVINSNIWFFGGFGPLPAGPLDMEDEEDEDSDEVLDQFASQQNAANFGWFDDLYTYDTKTKTWTQPLQFNLDKPTARCACTMVSYKDNLVIFGGRDADGRLNDVHRFNTQKKTWLKNTTACEGSPPSARSFHASTMIAGGSKMVVCGGRAPDNKHYNDVHIMDLDLNRWTEFKSVSGLEARGCHILCSVSNDLLLFGGSSDFNDTLQHCNKFHSDLLTTSIPADLTCS